MQADWSLLDGYLIDLERLDRPIIGVTTNGMQARGHQHDRGQVVAHVGSIL